MWYKKEKKTAPLFLYMARKTLNTLKRDVQKKKGNLPEEIVEKHPVFS